MKKHSFLTKEWFIETRSVGTRAKMDKDCEYCNKTIPIGQPHEVHYFAIDCAEYASYPTHTNCSDKFIKSLR